MEASQSHGSIGLNSNVADSTKRTVLIVDDDEVVRTQMENELRRAYFTPVSVACGNDAVISSTSFLIFSADR